MEVSAKHSRKKIGHDGLTKDENERGERLINYHHAPLLGDSLNLCHRSISAESADLALPGWMGARSFLRERPQPTERRMRPKHSSFQP